MNHKIKAFVNYDNAISLILKPLRHSVAFLEIVVWCFAINWGMLIRYHNETKLAANTNVYNNIYFKSTGLKKAPWSFSFKIIFRTFFDTNIGRDALPPLPNHS